MVNLVTDLSQKSLEQLRKQLLQYADSLEWKNRRFIELLLEVGIQVAEQTVSGGSHQMPDRISFYKEFKAEDDGSVTGLLIGVGETFFSTWYEADGTEHHDEVYPLAMMEFGSAALAMEPTLAYGGSGGRGTFSSKGHYTEYSWWIITGFDENGKPIRKLGTAIEPTRPMYNAVIEMQNQIRNCAIKAFGGGTV